MMKTSIYIFLILIGFVSCSEDAIEIPEYETKIVVDGWIEVGEVPEVMLTYSTPYFSEIDSFNIFDFVNARAKVTVSDGTTEEVLVLRNERKYFPPFVYRGLQIKGETGKTYTLTIEQSPHTLTATSSIPESPEIDSSWFSVTSNSDTLGSPFIVIQDNPNEKNYYRVLTRRYGIDQRFFPALVPNISDVVFKDNKIVFQVFKGSELEVIKDNKIYFNVKDSVIVKLLTMDETIYDYWDGFNNEKFNTGNPFADSKIRLQGNIEGGGLGIWAAYGKAVVGVSVR
jgi:hypothetical protein